MKICVLGGSGLIGSALLKQKNPNFEIIATYNTNTINHHDKSFRIKLPEEEENLKNLLKRERPELIINSIAYSNVDFCETHKDEAYKLNVESTKKIFKISSELDLKIIHISTDYVFDGTKEKYFENDKPNPINYYGITKRKSEEIILQNLENVVIRTSLVYGDNPNARFFNFVLKTLKNGKEIFVYNDVYSTPTLLEELVESVFKIAALDARGIFHVSGSSCVNKFEFAKTVTKILGLDEKLVKPISIKSQNLPAKRPIKTCLDNSKSSNLLKIRYSTLEEGIKKNLKI